MIVPCKPLDVFELENINFIKMDVEGASRPIRPDIHKCHKEMGCVVCGSHSDLVTDHKDDTYSNNRVLDASTQTIDDFQCLVIIVIFKNARYVKILESSKFIFPFFFIFHFVFHKRFNQLCKFGLFI